MNDAWIFDELKTYNVAQKNQKKSQLQHLQDIAAFPPQVLANAAEEQEKRAVPHILAFFQIPKPIFAGQELFTLPALEDKLFIDLQFTPIELDFDLAGRPRCIVETGQSSFRPNATQVCAFVPIWQKRAQYFPRYERCFTNQGMSNDIVIHGYESWIDGRPLRALDFEHNISDRIVREIQFAMRRFLKSYSTVVKEDFLTYDDLLYSYFIMPFPWRLSYGPPPTPTFKHYIEAHKQERSGEINTEKVRGGVSFSFRKFSRFEKQIFLLKQMTRQGNFALTVVNGLTLVEWILKINATGKDKKLNLYGLIQLFDDEIFPSEVREFLHELRRMRNTIIHLGEYSNFKGKAAHKIIDLDVDRQVSKEDALRIIDIAWSLFKESNSGTLQRQTKTKSNFPPSK